MDSVALVAEKVNSVRGHIESHPFPAHRTLRTVHLDHDQRSFRSDFDVQISLAAEILDNVHDQLNQYGRESVF
jgi:hypothetical protein